jgi:hypothetical protein
MTSGRSSIDGMADRLGTLRRREQSQPSREPARSATRHYAPPTANRSMSLTTMTRTKATMAHQTNSKIVPGGTQ